MNRRLPKIPPWAEQALQGVTYWIGHRRCLYHNYSLSEGAIVAEVCNLIHANLPNELFLKCEVQYSDIIKVNLPDILSTHKRADLVIMESGKEKILIPKFIIEVKRSSAPKSQIDADLERLAAAHKCIQGIRAFLFVISEAHLPANFVDETGKSIRGEKKIVSDSKGYYRIRRTLKAAHTFENTKNAQYASLLEVYY